MDERAERGLRFAGAGGSGQGEHEDPGGARPLASPGAGAAASTGRGARAGDWRRVLCGASPREVLARMIHGDPLTLAARIEARLRMRAYLFDADRVFLRAAARCARLCVRYRGDPPLERWLDERIDESLLDLLRADAEGDARGEPPGPQQLAAFEVLARPLGLDPAAMHHVCLVHNQLPEAQRKAFRELVIEGRSLDELAAAGAGSATEIARAARAALLTVLSAVESGGAA